MSTTTIPATPEFLTWQDVENLMSHLLPQLTEHYDALLMITRGGIVPGGLIAEALDIRYIVTAAVEFPSMGEERMAWPTFLQFPSDPLLKGKQVLIVDDIWENGRTITTVLGRVKAAGGSGHTAVLHYKPGTSLFKESGPDFYAAITDRFVIYPWELASSGRDRLRFQPPQPN
ncbi:MAG TPA: phosphoribosyltransferase family protein [Anaerolineae bacterium]